MPKAPAIPASLAALVTLVGLGLIYWSLTNLGLLTPSGATSAGSATGIGTPTGSGASTGAPGGDTLKVPGGPSGIRKYVPPVTSGGGGAKRS